MDAVLIQKFKDAISRGNNIGIVAPSNPTVDQMAAALSLYLILQSVNKVATVASASDPIVEVSSLVGINKVQKTLSGEAGDLVVSFPYLEGEIEKVSYTIENSYLNIIVKAAEQGLSFDDKDVKYTRGSGSVDLLFAIGITQLQEIGDVLDLDKLRNATIVNIDNNPSNQGFGDVVFVSPAASSISEQIADLALTLGFNLDADVAQNLMSGIGYATNNFQDPKTTPIAFEMMGILMKKGARRLTSQPMNSMGPRDEAQIRADLSGFMQPTEPRHEPQRPETRPVSPMPEQPTVQQRSVTQPMQQPPQRPQPMPSMPQQQPTPSQPFQDEFEDDATDNNKPPLDWLAPKVYKGSSNFEG